MTPHLDFHALAIKEAHAARNWYSRRNSHVGRALCMNSTAPSKKYRRARIGGPHIYLGRVTFAYAASRSLLFTGK